MALRHETPDDRAAIATLIAKTYGTAAADIIEKTGFLRNEKTLGDPVGYVWDEAGELKAYALCSPVVEGGKAVFMGPLAFDLSDEKFDFAQFLPSVFKANTKANIDAIIIAGNEDDNKDMGFVSAESLKIKANKTIDGGVLLVKPMVDSFKGGFALKLPDAL